VSSARRGDEAKIIKTRIFLSGSGDIRPFLHF